MDWLTGMLQAWGQDRLKLDAHTGYSSVSTFARIFEGATGRAGHKILCADLSGRSWGVEFMVRRMDPIYRDALIAKFSLPAKPDGTIWTDKDIARKFNVPVETFRTRVKRAKRHIRRELKASKQAKEKGRFEPSSCDLITESKTAGIQPASSSSALPQSRESNR